MPGETLNFALTGDDRKRMRRALYQRSAIMPLINWLAAAVWAGVIVATVVFAPRSSWNVPFLGIAAFMIVLYLFSGRIASSRIRRFAIEGSLDVRDDGLAGTLDGAAASIPWRAIASATDIGEAIVLTPRRPGAPAIGIPKANIPDVTAFWHFLADRMISKRNLVAPTIPGKQILNTAK